VPDRPAIGVGRRALDASDVPDGQATEQGRWVRAMQHDERQHRVKVGAD
jgi:hypothetical protein